MASPENDPSRLFRIRKTVMKMLNNRGYIVSDEELNLSIDQFRGKFGDHPSRDQLTILSEKMDDPTDSIFVFFLEDAKVGVKPIRTCIEKMMEEGVHRAILVVKEGVTPFAKQALGEVAPKMRIEHFRDSELLIDITEHKLVPKHVILTRDEKLALLKRYKLKDSQLPRMQVSDPISRYYGLSRGQVVRIVRPSETAGRYVTYRIVV